MFATRSMIFNCDAYIHAGQRAFCQLFETREVWLLHNFRAQICFLDNQPAKEMSFIGPWGSKPIEGLALC